MSVLIKGMEMPKPGRYEAVIIVLDKSTAEIAISPEEGDIGYWKEYPLVPVPPHGRLIDGDAAEGIYFTEEDENGKDFCDGILYAADWISEQPTIIPAEPPEEEA